MTVYENNNREEIIPECNGTKKTCYWYKNSGTERHYCLCLALSH